MIGLKHWSAATVATVYSSILQKHLTVCLTIGFCLNCSQWVVLANYLTRLNVFLPQNPSELL